MRSICIMKRLSALFLVLILTMFPVMGVLADESEEVSDTEVVVEVIEEVEVERVAPPTPSIGASGISVPEPVSSGEEIEQEETPLAASTLKSGSGLSPLAILGLMAAVIALCVISFALIRKQRQKKIEESLESDKR